MPGSLQEYVIRLSSEMDNDGVSKIMDALRKFKNSSFGVTAALTAATTAVYKFVESATKKELQLQSLAKTQKKNIDQVRAEKEALDQMGMALNDIKKDAALKSIYDDLVKFNKEMRMPNAENALTKVRNLQGAFWKLKSAVSYFIQGVGTQVLINLEAPLGRVTDKLNKIAGWVRDNLTHITTTVAKYMTAFSKGIIGIFEGVERIFEFVQKLPDGVKGVATAIAALFAIIKSGPIGWLIAAISTIGDLIHDFENYQYNKQHGFQKGDEGYVNNLNDVIAIWDAIDDANKTGIEKASTVGTLLLNAIAEGIRAIPADRLGEEVGNFITDIFTKLTEAMEGIGDGNNLFSALGNVAESLVNGLFKFISATLNTVNLSSVQTAIEAIIDKVFSLFTQALSSLSDLVGTINNGVNASGDSESFILTFVKGIVNGISKGFEKLTSANVIGDLNSIIQNIFGILSGVLSDALDLVLGTENPETGEFEKGLLDYGLDFATSLVKFIGEGAKSLDVKSIGTSIGDIINKILASITEFIGNADGKKFFDSVSDTIKSIITGVFNFFPSVLGSINLEDVETSVKTIITKLFELFKEAVSSLSDLSDVTEEAEESLGETTEKAEGIISSLAKGILSGLSKGFEALTSSEVFDDIKNIVNNVFSLITTALGDALKIVSGTEDTETGLFKDGLIQYGADFIKSILGFIKEGFTKLSDGGGITEISDLVQNIFGKITDTIKSAIQAIIGGKNAQTGKYEKGLIQYGADFARSILQFITEGAKTLGTEGENIAAEFGSFISTIFSKIGDFLSNSGSDFANLLGDGFTAVSTVAQKILDVILSGIKSLGEPDEEGKTGIQRFIKGIFDFISDTIKNLSDKIDTGELNLEETFGNIGTTIGEIIGNAIEIGIDFVSTFIKNAKEFITNNSEGLMNIGKSIAKAIIGGIASMFSAMFMRLILGDEGYEYYKKNSKEPAKITEGENGTTVIEQGGLTEQRAFASEEEKQEYLDSVSEKGILQTARDESKKQVYSVAGGAKVRVVSYDEATNEYLMGVNNAETNFFGQDGLWSGFYQSGFAGTEAWHGILEAVDRALFDKEWAGEKFTEEEEAVDKALDAIQDAALQGKEISTEDMKTVIDYAKAHEEELGQVIHIVSSDFSSAGSAAQDFATSAEGAANRLDGIGAGNGVANEAMGGRFDKPFNARVAEAGPEYIIPITKGAQAIWLATQMLAEMGKDAFKRIASALGYSEGEDGEQETLTGRLHEMASGIAGRVGKDFALNTPGTIGSSFTGIESALQSMQQVYNYNISAPVSIMVQSSGANAEEIGTAAYNAAERHLMKTLRGAYA